MIICIFKELTRPLTHNHLTDAPPLIPPTPRSARIAREREGEWECVCAGELTTVKADYSVSGVWFCPSTWEGSSLCKRRDSRFVPLLVVVLQKAKDGFILVSVGLGHLYYEFLCRSASVSWATFQCATAPLSRASLRGKVYTQPSANMGSRWAHRLSHFLRSQKQYNNMQKSVRYNEGHALFLSAIARKEGTKRGYLSKKTAENSRWHEKFFALYQNVLFYFENEQSARPAGIYLLEGCTCERAPAPKMSTTGKEALEKQVSLYSSRETEVAIPCCE